MSNDKVCSDRTSISMCTNGLDISGLHVLTFSMQIIALDDYSHKNTKKPFISVQFGQNFDASNSEIFKRESHWDAGSRSFNGRGVCASWIVYAGS